MGIYGYSRGGMAASLLAVQLDDVRAVVFEKLANRHFFALTDPFQHLVKFSVPAEF